MKAKILVVDDDASIREFLEIMLKRDNYEVKTAINGEKAWKQFQKESFDVVITDMQMPKMSGIELLEKIKESNPETVVLVITAFGSTETAVDAMRLGAFDYIAKPFKIDEIKNRLKNALKNRTLTTENREMRRELGKKYSFDNIIGSTEAMEKLFELIQRVSETKSNVLITGESGTGKELIAKAVHFNGPLQKKPFVTVNCGAIPENLLESEMFGHKKGSFTGAVTDKIGLFKVADGGTIFLDELGELPVALQVKLLRVIQEGTFRPVGSTEDIQVQVRIISATNKDLVQEIRAKRFREDLFYRMNVIQVHAPALRDHKEDIPILIDHFLTKFNKELGRSVQKVSKEAMKILNKYGWPGNVRELENVIERAVALEPGNAILPESLPGHLKSGGVNLQGVSNLDVSADGLNLEEVVGKIEKELLQQALAHANGVKKKAAKLLGISFRSMRYRLEKYGMEVA
ncbi:sigma-54-dependent transcriptional regulator [Bdellovibrionota bacterium]